jgi:soluble lytic murein transglycosylase
LRYLKNYSKAILHFKKLYDVVKQPISVARASYWLGRSYKAIGDKNNMDKFFKIASTYPYTFYGQLASVEIGVNPITNIKTNDKYEYNFSSLQPEIKELLVLTKILAKSNMIELAKEYAKGAILLSQNKNQSYIILSYLKSINNLHILVEAAKSATHLNFFFLEFSYPVYDRINSHILDKYVIYSIIRQESVFNQYAISSANAMGLMQVTPATECDIALKLKRKCMPRKLLSNKDYNIEHGSRRFQEVFNKYDKSFIVSMAAYNAGPSNARKWINIFGDPRNMNNVYNAIDWIENIPFYETRNYIQRVIENMQIYRHIITNDKKLHIYDDLGFKTGNVQ